MGTGVNVLPLSFFVMFAARAVGGGGDVRRLQQRLALKDMHRCWAFLPSSMAYTIPHEKALLLYHPIIRSTDALR